VQRRLLHGAAFSRTADDLMIGGFHNVHASSDRPRPESTRRRTPYPPVTPVHRFPNAPVASAG